MATDCTFPGINELTAMLDEAVQQPSVDLISRRVKDGLSQLIKDGVISLPEPLRKPDSECYARRLLCRCPKGAYEVIAMIWGRGQGTPLHDHAGIWCVDGVLDGVVRVTQFDLKEQKGDLYRFQSQGAIDAGLGEAGRLIPPFEYHTIENANPAGPSVTIHIYGGQMDHCTVFEPVGDNWYSAAEKSLRYFE